MCLCHESVWIYITTFRFPRTIGLTNYICLSLVSSFHIVLEMVPVDCSCHLQTTFTNGPLTTPKKKTVHINLK
jgi:hypothetical protein